MTWFSNYYSLLLPDPTRKYVSVKQVGSCLDNNSLAQSVRI